ncbi:MAG: pentapeptide repeat-containing protein [Acidimicrobiales bacterium]
MEVNGYTIEPGANLLVADLTGVDLRGANLVRTVLNGATASPLTGWPDGFNPEAAKVIFG